MTSACSLAAGAAGALDIVVTKMPHNATMRNSDRAIELELRRRQSHPFMSFSPDLVALRQQSQ
jgi:hypothetical protein